MRTRRAFIRDTIAMLSGLQSPAYAAQPGLRDLAAARGLIYGCATYSKALDDDPTFSAVIQGECAMLVPEWEMKWIPTEPAPGIFDFSLADKLLKFAHDARMSARGVTLIWHEAMPQWLSAALKHTDPQEARRLMSRHIRRVVGHYRGQLTSWDVVNEAIRPEDGHNDGLRDTPWLRCMGPSYVERAFRLAYEADPGTPLVYNEFGLEYELASHHSKRQAVLSLLRKFRKMGVPCSALGIQAHLFAGTVPFDAGALSRFLSDVANLDYQILITELDVNDAPNSTDARDRDKAIAEEAERFLEVALAQKKVRTLVTWGLSDRYTWLHDNSSNRQQNVLARPLPLDVDLQRKPLWFGIANAIRNAPSR